MKQPRFGSLIRERRQSLGLTQTQLSEKLGYGTPQFLSLLERDQCPIPFEVLGKLIVILGIPEDEVFNELIASYRTQIEAEIAVGKKKAQK